MADRSSGSAARVLAILGLLLLAGVAIVVWLALRADPAPPAEPPRPPPKARVAEPPPPPRTPRPRALEPISIEPQAPSVPGEPHERDPDDREPVRLDVLVFGADGLAAEGATVLLLDPFAQHAGPERAAELARAASDEEGRAKFEVAGRTVRVYAWRGDEAGASDKFRVSESRASVSVRLAAAIGVRGRVVEPGGAPVGGAGVRLVVRPLFDDPFGLQLEAKSAEDGTFGLPAVPGTAFSIAPDAVAIETRATGWPLSRTPLSADLLRAGEVVVTLDRGGFLRGRLVSAPGDPLPARQVRLSDGRSVVASGADGRFELPLPRDGGHVLVMGTGARGEAGPAPRGAAKLLGRFRGEGGDIDLGDVTISEGLPVTGRIVDLDDRPVKAGDVILYLGGLQVAAAQSDELGNFEIDGIGDDPHVLQATEAPGENAWSGRRHVTVEDVRGGAGDLRIVLTGALSVHVRFELESDRSPVVVPQVALRATATGATPRDYGWSWAGARIDSVRFDVEHAGTYDVTVELPGYEPATATGVPVSPDREVRIEVLFRKRP